MYVYPISNLIVIQRVESEKVTQGGILLTDVSQKRPQEGIVQEVGPGKFENGSRIEMQVKPGDRVLFKKNAGYDFKDEDRILTIISEEDVYGVIEE